MTLTPEQLTLRRKIAAAKSYLSRLDNQRREVLRGTERTGESGIDEFRRLTNKRDAQYFKFRELCNQLPGCDDDY
jgi:hypothetical protein